MYPAAERKSYYNGLRVPSSEILVPVFMINSKGAYTPYVPPL
jgi:hypothetical protein